MAIIAMARAVERTCSASMGTHHCVQCAFFLSEDSDPEPNVASRSTRVTEMSSGEEQTPLDRVQRLASAPSCGTEQRGWTHVQVGCTIGTFLMFFYVFFFFF